LKTLGHSVPRDCKTASGSIAAVATPSMVRQSWEGKRE
jgi:hypothetical protein